MDYLAGRPVLVLPSLRVRRGIVTGRRLLGGIAYVLYADTRAVGTHTVTVGVAGSGGTAVGGVQPTGFDVAAGRRWRMDATIEDAEERNAGKGTTHLPSLMEYCYQSCTYRRTGPRLPA